MKARAKVKKLTAQEKKWRAEYRAEIKRRIKENTVTYFEYPPSIKKHLKAIKEWVKFIENQQTGIKDLPRHKPYAAHLGNCLFLEAAALSTELKDFAEQEKETTENTNNKTEGTN